MACIVEKLAMNLNKEVTSKGVWDHLASLYDLKKLVCSLSSIFTVLFCIKEFVSFSRMSMRRFLSPMKKWTSSFPLRSMAN